MQERREGNEFHQLVLFSIYGCEGKSDMDQSEIANSIIKYIFYVRDVVVRCNVIQTDMAIIDVEKYVKSSLIINSSKLSIPLITMFSSYFMNEVLLYLRKQMFLFVIFYSISDLKMSKMKSMKNLFRHTILYFSDRFLLFYCFK